MNKTFGEYTTSTAFMLALSKTQCNALLRYRRDGFVNGWVTHHGMGTLRSLEARGLVEWGSDVDGGTKFKGITKAGEMVTDLLIEAGLTVESTNSVSVLKRAA
jgi:hypothetical protein